MPPLRWARAFLRLLVDKLCFRLTLHVCLVVRDMPDGRRVKVGIHVDDGSAIGKKLHLD